MPLHLVCVVSDALQRWSRRRHVLSSADALPLKRHQCSDLIICAGDSLVDALALVTASDLNVIWLD